MLLRTLVSTLVIALAGALPGSAATLSVSNGILTGATGVTIGRKVYSVEFVDGSCLSLFSNCADDPAASGLPAFAFSTSDQARLASLALLVQVMIDSPLGAFDSDPALTAGCETASCVVLTPYTTFRDAAEFLAITAQAINLPGAQNDAVGTMLSIDADVSTGSFRNSVFARWTETAVIPLPAAGWMMLSALVALGGLRLRRRWQG